MIYEIVPAIPSEKPPSAARPVGVDVRFIKASSKVFEAQKSEEMEKGVLAEQRKISRTFIPFSSIHGTTSLSGVFFTGDRPSWIVATDKGGLQTYPSGHAVVHSFTACSLWESKGDFLIYSDEVSCIVNVNVLFNGVSYSFGRVVTGSLNFSPF